MKRQLTIIFALVVGLLAGCASTQNAGYSGFEVKRDDKGRCLFTMQDGKEYSDRNVSFDGQTCAVVVQEGASKAFKGQAIGAKALAVFPITDLANILAK